MTARRHVLKSLSLGLIGAAAPWVARAQSDYPSKPIKLIVAFPPGGTSDVMGRMINDPLSKILGQPVLIENIGGAGGVIGMERALAAPPDGYTLIQTGVGQNAVAHGLDPKIKYNSRTDFIHLSQVHHGPNVRRAEIPCDACSNCMRLERIPCDTRRRMEFGQAHDRSIDFIASFAFQLAA